MAQIGTHPPLSPKTIERAAAAERKMDDLNMSTPSVASFITYLRNPGKGSDATAAKILESLLTERDALAAKLAEAEERIQRLIWPEVDPPDEPDKAIEDIVTALFDCEYVDFVSKNKAYPTYKGSPKDIGALVALARSYRVQRDAAVSEVERLKGEIERLGRNLEGRDKFIVDSGLWQAFTEQLP